MCVPCIVLLLLVSGCVPYRGMAWRRHTIDDASRGADGVRLADVNGDGLMDIATGWEEGGRIRVCINPGPDRVGKRWPAVTVGEVAAPEDAVFVDLDGNGATDVVSACEGGGKSIWVHWAPNESGDYLDSSAWTTQALPAARNVGKWMFCLPMDVDGQRGIDLVAGAKGSDARIGWFESPENPRDLAAWKWHPIHEAGWIMSLVAADMDGDGDLDILTSDRRGAGRGCKWLENPGPGVRQLLYWRIHPIGGQGREVMFLVHVDLDGDGLEDVLSTTRNGGLLFFRRTTADPVAWEEFIIDVPDGVGTGKGVNVGDIDRDGRPDIVLTCERAREESGVVWLSYPKAPTDRVWVSHEISGPVGTKYDLVELLDLDGDGDLDVITCEEAENLGVIWYEQP